ncbi:MAG: indole-3-glycerol phosphate synthase TrpC [Tepidisphaeraceae bacterium]
MQTMLEKIIATKKFEVAERSILHPVEELKRQIADQAPPRNFFQAIAKDPVAKPVNVIAEVKKASPSAGLIREDFNPSEIARIYADNGADAISVLTDEKYFLGHLDFLKQVRAAVGLPVLRKDFIIDPYQVYEARAAGADAILLIAECLPTNVMIDLQILATELKMTVLNEVHDMENLIRVRDSVIGFPHRSYSLLGINNRDLRTFKTDLGTTLRMLELVADPTVLVSESGIHTKDHVLKLAKAGVRGVLVGESLMRSDDIGAKMREMFH